MSYDSTETIWHMRRCPVLCGTTTSWTSSKKNKDKNSSSGLSLFSTHFPPVFSLHYCTSILLPVFEDFWNSLKARKCWLIIPIHQKKTLRMRACKTPVLHTSGVRIILRFLQIVPLHRLLLSKCCVLNLLQSVQMHNLSKICVMYKAWKQDEWMLPHVAYTKNNTKNTQQHQNLFD